MIRVNDKSKCCGCMACVSSCPVNCISIEQDKEGFLYPKIDDEKCIKCGKCERVCPFLRLAPKAESKCAYAGYNLDLELRLKSSSGGVFSVIAENILNKKGSVYGVTMSDDCEKSQFIKIETKDKLDTIRGSKYLQSEISGIFEDVEKDLKNGKKVLFSGTPCQVNALKNFLGKEYNNLLCIDFICHGVPSPLLWKKYLNYIEEKKRIDITNIDFRNKKLVNTLSEKIIKHDNSSFFIPKDESSYFQMFMKNLSLRPSCYNCQAKANRFSDVTIGDFWGIEQILPNINDEKGCSVIIIRSLKGNKVIEELKKLLELYTITYEEAITNNPSDYLSVEEPIERKKFFEDMNSLKYVDLENKYIYPKFKHKIKKILIEYRLLSIVERFRGKIEKKFDFGLRFWFKK